MAGRTFVIGDIHGAFRALVQCTERSGFDPVRDRLIILGDLTDGWPEVDRVIETLRSFSQTILLQGNHDYWALRWMKSGYAYPAWVNQGGRATMKSYSQEVPVEHIRFLEEAEPYHIEGTCLFVHAGIDPERPLNEQDSDIFIWDRNLVMGAITRRKLGKDTPMTSFDEVFIGHTPTLNFGTTEPIKACEVWLMDTGAGWEGGKLSMMDVRTKEIFQSDFVQDLYPGIQGR